MSVSYSAGYESGSAYPMTHPRILWNALAATVTSSGEADGHPADRVIIPDTSTWWESTTGATTRTLTLDLGAAHTVDAIGIARHNLGGQAVLIEGATDLALTTWVTLADLDPADDSTLLALVTPGASKYGIRISVTVVDDEVATEIGVVYAGQALVMPVRGYQALGPIDLGMEVGISSYRTESGQLAGRFIEYAGLSGNLMFTHLPEPWVRSSLLPFIKEAITTPFFIATRPQGYADDCAFAWTMGNVIPRRMGLKNFMSVQMEVNAHAPVSLF